jgi:hypothetical protein
MDTPIEPNELSFEEVRRPYHRSLGDLSHRVVARKARGGECVGCAPTGYRNARVNGKATVEIDPVLGPLVAEAFRLAGRKRRSLRKILAELTPKGLASRNGKPMYPSLRAILTNPFYVGMVRYEGQFFEGKHPPLVSPSRFDRVGRSLRKRRCWLRRWRLLLGRSQRFRLMIHEARPHGLREAGHARMSLGPRRVPSSGGRPYCRATPADFFPCFGSRSHRPPSPRPPAFSAPGG